MEKVRRARGEPISAAMPHFWRFWENAVGSMGWTTDAQDVHKLDHKKCGKRRRSSSAIDPERRARKRRAAAPVMPAASRRSAP
ncbi:hypothetical protein I6G56_24825 [Burkholderia humptydooensis]|uniref:Uncharacterized protein n=2 Tax=Burkholderia humptydooensis TaxID=430531 RepID=A0A7T2U9P4_9BURK|nr:MULTISPECIES: hypothetical protein [Burkholderia]EIP87158.1 hypothetical protein A33K_16762 [Burkholderia humptydooensis MSMB43]QPS48064.1 hypothetical protein I6G56_24825 [Burkholderia humptydooensis]